MPSETCAPEKEATHFDPELKVDLECLSKIEDSITGEKIESSNNLYLFFR